MKIKDSKIIITPKPDNYVEHYYSVLKGPTVKQLKKLMPMSRERGILGIEFY